MHTRPCRAACTAARITKIAKIAKPQNIGSKLENIGKLLGQVRITKI